MFVANWASTGHWRTVTKVGLWKPWAGWVFSCGVSVTGINWQVCT